jgi:hypothetical protein
MECFRQCKLLRARIMPLCYVIQSLAVFRDRGLRALTGGIKGPWLAYTESIQVPWLT